MSRFPSPTLADRIDDRIQELDDGFVRLGARTHRSRFAVVVGL